MTETGEGSRRGVVKVVLVGVPGSGKGSILRLVADRWAHGAVQSSELGGGEVLRTEFLWPNPFEDGKHLRVQLFALSGAPSYNALGELLLSASDGVVFVADALVDSLERAKAALRAVVFNSRQHGIDLAAIPIAMQYHRTDLEPGFRSEDLDERLGITPGSLPSFATSLHDGSDPGAAVGWVLHELTRRKTTALNGNGA